MSTNTNQSLPKAPFSETNNFIYDHQIDHHCFDVFVFFIAIVDTRGKITYLNKRARELLNLNSNELIGDNFISKLIIKEDRGRIRLRFNEVFKNKNVYGDNIRYHIGINKKGSRIIDARNIRIFDTKHNVKGILITGKDLTEYIFEQENLQKDIQLYRALLNNIPELNIFVFDKELRFLLAEGFEMKNLGMKGDNITGKTLSEISYEKIKNLWEPLFQKAIKGEKVRKEYQVDNYYYLIRITPLLGINNEVTSGIAITRNITYEKLTNKILNDSRAEAVKSERAKSQFLARVSHDIRTPLNAIMGFSEQLLQTELSGQQREYLEIIDKSSEHLLTLINDILVYSKIEAGQLSFVSNPFVIENVVNYVHSSLLPKANEKDLQFKIEIDKKLNLILKGDSFRLQQILMNMLNNAIKFTNSGFVKLSCQLENETPADVNVKFEVIDTGVGIPSGSLKKIFNQYVQEGGTNGRNSEGTGLGLTICKRLIELQNGSLSVSSQKGKGTTFSFILSYSKGKETDILPFDTNTIDPEKLSNIRILLVDDDSINLFLGETILKKFNCFYELAGSGEEAIIKINNQKFDMLLLDIHMPGISGIEVAKYLRNEVRDKHCKIIALTAAAIKDEIIKYHQAGIDDFLIKPFREINLYNKICELLRIKKTVHFQPKTEIILKSEIYPKPYNLFELQRMVNNDQVFINETLKTFIENSEDAIRKFRTFLKEENWIQISEIAHKILPSYRHLEVETVTPKLLELKMITLNEPDLNSVQILITDTIAEMEKVIRYLKREIES